MKQFVKVQLLKERHCMTVFGNAGIRVVKATAHDQEYTYRDEVFDVYHFDADQLIAAVKDATRPPEPHRMESHMYLGKDMEAAS